MPHIIRSAATVVTIVVSAAVVIARSQEIDTERAAALRMFEHRTTQYAAVHQQLEGLLPPLTPSTDARALKLHGARLAAAIKASRPDAEEGDIFTPAVSRAFRGLILEALKGRDAELLLRERFEENPPIEPHHPRVYDVYPDWATHEMPVILLQRLPVLPHDIEYRLIDHDLVLWDIHADLIVDVLRDAIPRPTT